jgi:hypothetical protein
MMCEWKGTAGKSFLIKILAIAAVWTFVWMSIMTQDAWDVVCCATAVYILLIIISAFVLIVLIPSVRGHVYSMWDMDPDMVAWRIDQAIKRRIPNNVILYEGSLVIFQLPPLSIVVAPGYKRTKVYVGPLTDDNRPQVEALKAFVDAALGKRRSPPR